MIDVFELLEQLWEAIQMVGASLLGLVELILDAFHIAVPTFMVELAVAIFLIMVLLKWGKNLGKIIVIILLLFVAATLFHALLS